MYFILIYVFISQFYDTKGAMNPPHTKISISNTIIQWKESEFLRKVVDSRAEAEHLCQKITTVFL